MNRWEIIDSGWARAHPLPEPGDGGKEARGRVVVIGGDADLLGAVMLAGEASLRAGAGKLQLAAPASAVAALSLAVPEAMVLALADPSNSAAPLRESLDRCHAALIGPGMMSRHAQLAREFCEIAKGPLVLDAGALDAADTARSPALVLTPHAGEMARLLDTPKAQVEADPLAHALQAARRFGAIVVMKGARTWIADRQGRVAFYSGGGAGLGVSGSGDVLGGLITGLLARGAGAFEASAWGVLLHGEAGRRLAGRVGPLGYLAREIAREVPALMAAYGDGRSTT